MLALLVAATAAFVGWMQSDLYDAIEREMVDSNGSAATVSPVYPTSAVAVVSEWDPAEADAYAEFIAHEAGRGAYGSLDEYPRAVDASETIVLNLSTADEHGDPLWARPHLGRRTVSGK